MSSDLTEPSTEPNPQARDLHDSHCERAAGQVFRHRHTLRSRIRRIEQLTGCGLCRQHDRIEPWLRLRGRELAP